MSDFKRQLGSGPFREYGDGSYIQEYPQMHWIPLPDFGGGYDSRDAREDLPRNASPNCLDVEIDRKNRIVRVPGTSALETFAGRSIRQAALHASLDFSSELVFFDPPFIGVRSTGATEWQNVGLPKGKRPFTYTNFGSTLIFSNGNQGVYARQARSNAIETLEEAPPATSYASFAGRVFAGGAILDGNLEPLGIAWSAANSDYTDWQGYGAGFELLINDLASGDKVIALRTMGLDFMAVCLRKSIWIARRTGLRDRPADFQPRETGLGFVNSESVRTTRFGVMGLSDSGVYLFDGNTAKHVSAQIDADLLPLDVDQLEKYVAWYNPVMAHYTLMTPTGTWVYDMSYDRWYRRSLTADYGVVFPIQLGGVKWGELTGQWAAQDNSWLDYRPYESSDFQVLLLRPDGLGNTLLHMEDIASGSNFGTAMLPYWETPMAPGQYSYQLMTVQRTAVVYEGGGAINLHLPNNTGQMEAVRTAYALPAQAYPDARMLPSNHTGRGAGCRIEIASGSPKIGRIELGVLLRGPRIQSARPFTVREYREEF